MNTRYFYLLRFALAGCDLILFNLCLFLGYYFAKQYLFFLKESLYTSNALVASLAWLLCAHVFSLYEQATVHKHKLIREATWKTFTLHSLLLLVYLLLKDFQGFHYAFFLCYLLLMSTGILLSRYTGKVLLMIFNRKFDFRKAVAVLNLSQGGTKLASYLKKQRSINFMGFLKTQPANLEMSLGADFAVEQLKAAYESGVEEVYVSVPPNQINDYSHLVEAGDKHCLRLKIIPDLSAFETNFSVGNMGEFKVLSVRKEPLENMSNRFVKRFFDIVVSSFTIIFILSWLYPLLAILIKIQSRGPVLFMQVRTGRDNKPFNCYKFRSMYLNNSSSKNKAGLVTPIGKFMRRTSLDEFPQFLNVLLGNMTIIGPRPHMLADTNDYSKIINQYMVRQFVKPGISGWAQVNGYRGQTMNTDQMEKRVEHDLWYMENWSMLLDIKIILLTIQNIFKGEENAF